MSTDDTIETGESGSGLLDPEVRFAEDTTESLSAGDLLPSGDAEEAADAEVDVVSESDESEVEAEPGAAVDADDVEVDAMRPLQIGRCKEMAHERFQIDPVRAGHNDDPGRILMIGLVPQVDNHRQLLRLHLGRDLFEDLGTAYLERQSRHDDITILDLVSGA